MTLTQDDIQSLAWGSAALSDEAHKNYNALAVEKMAAMSEVRHRMLSYEIEWEVMPKYIDEVDQTKNAELLPETFNERAYAIKSITHRKLSYNVDKECSRFVKITSSGHIIIQT